MGLPLEARTRRGAHGSRDQYGVAGGRLRQGKLRATGSGVKKGSIGRSFHPCYPCRPSHHPSCQVMTLIERQAVCVVGLGYIGLPTAAVLASCGYKVHGVETDVRAREIINSGRAHIIEHDLDMLVRAGIESGRLAAFAEPVTADVFVLCVPTPLGPDRGADLTHVRAATESICPVLKKGDLVILESTSPPGTTKMIAELVFANTDLEPGDLYFVHAPERVLPGRILHEVVQNDRIIGGLDEESTQKGRAFFETFVRGELILCDSRMAEMAKLVENASRDVQIAFANELSMLCEDLDIDVRELIEIANRHPRVNILEPGPGVGGHCIAVDPWFIVDMAKGKARLLETARAVNDSKPRWVADKVKNATTALIDPVIACFGATYKADIDDLRESPALKIIQDLQASGVGRVLVVDPNLDELPGCQLVAPEVAYREADVFVFLVPHAPFFLITSEQRSKKIVIDVCGVTSSRTRPRTTAGWSERADGPIA